MSTPTPPPADPTPDREERELAALYRQLPATEPDEVLDARVLDQARRAVRRPPRRRYRSLLIGLAGTATLVMAAGLTWRMHSAGHGRVPGQAAPAAAPAARVPEIAPIRQVVPVRILSGQSDGTAGAGSTTSKPGVAETRRETAAPAKTQPTSASTNHAIRVVVPVRVIRGGAKTHARLVLPPPPGTGAQSLVEQARRALSRKDLARARALVHELETRYPNRRLPPELLRLKPTPDRQGSP